MNRGEKWVICHKSSEAVTALSEDSIMSEQPDSLQFRFPSHADAILSRMNGLREGQHFCDVTLLLGASLGTAGQSYCFHGHKVVLAAASDFLRDQFLLNAGQAELRVSVVTSVEVGRRLLLSCYTGLLEVPQRELVSYLTAASALQMTHVVEKCAQAISLHLGTTLAYLKLENASKEEEIQQPDGAWTQTAHSEREQREGVKYTTFSLEADIEKEEAVVIKSFSDTHQDTKVIKSEGGAGYEDRGCCLKTLESEAYNITPVNTNSLSHKDEHFIGALKCKVHDAAVFTNLITSAHRESPATPISNDTFVDNLQEPDNGKGELNDKQETHETAAPVSKQGGSIQVPRQCPVKCHKKGDTVAVDPDSLLVQKSYLCQQCGQVFQHVENYVKHLKEHRDYVCLVCEKSFSQKSNLSRHIRVHTGAKPYRCPLCHNTFSTKASLQDHLNLHTGHKPHKCNYCTAHFAHKPGLRRHLTDIHGKSTLENVLEDED